MTKKKTNKISRLCDGQTIVPDRQYENVENRVLHTGGEVQGDDLKLSFTENARDNIGSISELLKVARPKRAA